jgi:elongation factor 1-gamma
LGESGKPDSWKVLVTAKYAGVQVDFQAQEKIEAEKSPLERPPVLETKEGHLFETAAIARYIARVGKKLYGNNEFEAGSIDQWIEFSATQIELPGAVWVFPILGYIPHNAAAVQKAKGDVRRALDILNKHLASRTFLVGERISLADIIVGISLVQLFEHALETGFRKGAPNVQRWAATLYNQPEFKAVLGRDIKFCDKAAAPKEYVAPEPAKPQQQQEKKEAAPKKEAKPKKKEEAEDDEGADEESFEEPKKKNPLDFLPPSSLNLDEWKRTYSNEDDTRGVALPWFWNKLDKQGWSLWFGEYKYNSELQKVFMTCNFVNGYIQRLERLRKYGFGSFVIFGDEGALEIATVFLVRGQELPAEMIEAEDTELYTWRKLNADDAKDREIVTDFWSWSGFADRKLKFNQGKIFK